MITSIISRIHESTALLIALMVLLSGCGKNTTGPAESASQSDVTPVSSESAITPNEDAGSSLSDGSLYLLDAAWTDQNGRTVQLSNLQGQPVLISMVFTRCGYACPMIVRDMKRITADLPENIRSELRYVLVSIDPDNDTPEVLSTFATTHKLDPEQWTLLRGNEIDVRMLAALLGVKYKQETSGTFSHSNTITILNDGGEIVHQQEGIGSNPAQATSVLRSL